MIVGMPFGSFSGIQLQRFEVTRIHHNAGANWSNTPMNFGKLCAPVPPLCASMVHHGQWLRG